MGVSVAYVIKLCGYLQLLGLRPATTSTTAGYVPTATVLLVDCCCSFRVRPLWDVWPTFLCTIVEPLRPTDHPENCRDALPSGVAEGLRG
jgi:hypothetical protein